MDTEFTKHHVIDMDETMVQRCIICGDVISDYRNAMYRLEDGPPKGFPAGDVFILKGNPTLFKTMISNREEFKTCNS